MKFNQFILTLFVMGFAVPLFALTGWPNEPAGSDVRLDCSMDNINCNGLMNYGVTPGVILQPSGPMFSPPNALAHVLPKGSSYVPTGTNWFGSDHPMDDIYVGFWWKINKDFEGYYSNANKVAFVRSANVRFGKATTNGVFGMYGVRDHFPMSFVFGTNTNGLDNSHICAGGGGELCFPNVYKAPSVNQVTAFGVPTQPNINRDVWYKVEAYIKSSSCNTCRDGILRWWINDTLMGDYQDFNYGSGNVNEFHIEHTWGGVGTAGCSDPVTNPNGRDCTREWIHYFDHIRISEPNCGSAGCTITPYVRIEGTLASAKVGTDYKDTLFARGAQAPYTYTLVSGNLLGGISLSSSGIISGTPTCGGKTSFTVQATDANGVKGTGNFSIVASGSPICAPAEIKEISKGKPFDFAQGELQNANIKIPELRIETKAGNVRFILPGASAYQLSVYDLAGKEIWNMEGRPIGSPVRGKKQIQMNGVLTEGVYFVKAVIGKKQMMARFVALR